MESYNTVAGWNLAPPGCWNPLNNGINYLSLNWLAGFQPSTVVTNSSSNKKHQQSRTRSSSSHTETEVFTLFGWYVFGVQSYLFNALYKVFGSQGEVVKQTSFVFTHISSYYINLMLKLECFFRYPKPFLVARHVTYESPRKDMGKLWEIAAMMVIAVTAYPAIRGFPRSSCHGEAKSWTLLPETITYCWWKKSQLGGSSQDHPHL